MVTELSAVLDATDRALIDEHGVEAPWGPTTAVELAVRWSHSVAKLDDDRALPWSDHGVWTEHDLVGALYLRDAVETGLDALPEPARAKVAAFVGRVDDRYRSFTVDDPSGRMGVVAVRDLTGRGWWWFRVPSSGPIVRDLRSYAGPES
jgi:hypothetical protein